MQPLIPDDYSEILNKAYQSYSTDGMALNSVVHPGHVQSNISDDELTPLLNYDSDDGSFYLRETCECGYLNKVIYRISKLEYGRNSKMPSQYCYFCNKEL